MNEILHSITNRDLSGIPALRTGTPFLPMSPDPYEDLRALLGLDRTDCTYYVLGVVGAVYSFPALAAEFKEHAATFRISDIPHPEPVFDGVVVAPTAAAMPEISRIAGLNFDPVITLSYADARTLGLLIDGVRYHVPVTKAGDKLILLPHDAPLSVKGALQLQTAWDDTFRASITLYPPFPYSSVIEAVERSRAYIPLLLTRGLTDCYLFAESDMERVAVLATALGLSNTSVYVG